MLDSLRDQLSRFVNPDLCGISTVEGDRNEQTIEFGNEKAGPGACSRLQA
jgi:hypothetical protein